MNFNKNHTYISDLDVVLTHVIGLEKLRNLSILITGASGTIGSFVSDALIRFNQKENANMKIYLAGRDPKKLHELFGETTNVEFLTYDMNKPLKFNVVVDYIIHAAGNAYPAAFNKYPVETIMGNINSTYYLLEFLKEQKGQRLLYVSSGEVYGQCDDMMKNFKEDYVGYLNNNSPRSCYPLSKRMAENLCSSYYKQHGIETVVVRPCHTYGPCITRNDNRAHAQFLNNAVIMKDIVMKSLGTQLRSYNYVGDCASALLTALLEGTSGEAYNLANSQSRVTIAGLAKLIAERANCNVVFEKPNVCDLAERSPISRQVLDTKKIEALGWQPAFSLEEGICHTLDIIKESLFVNAL